MARIHQMARTHRIRQITMARIHQTRQTIQIQEARLEIPQIRTIRHHQTITGTQPAKEKKDEDESAQKKDDWKCTGETSRKPHIQNSRKVMM